LLPVLLLFTALIVYGSLYPWQFHAAAVPGNPLLILLQSWNFEVNRYFVKDTAVNIVLYVPFGAACYLWLAKRPLWLKLAMPMLLALTLSASMEMLQLFDGKRVCSMLDVVTNVVGAGLRILLAALFRPYVSMRPRAAGPLFLLLCWVSANYYPFMPDLSGYHLLAKLRALAVPSFAPVAFFSAFATWLAAVRVMEAAYSRPWFLLLLASLPLRFFVSGLTLSWTEIASAAAAAAIWLSWPVKARGHDLALATLSLLAILATGLSPFHFAPNRQEFSWIPFRALFSTDWETGFGIFFRKSFAYGSSIWLLASAGLPLRYSGAGVAIILALLEAAQLWLPNHVSESTDPLHALMLAWILARLSRNVKRSQHVC
jgi:VanZ family protein